MNLLAALLFKKNFLMYNEMYGFLCKKFPKELFLVMPHPGEGIQYYKKLEKKYII